jgi:hypothetical protein
VKEPTPRAPELEIPRLFGAGVGARPLDEPHDPRALREFNLSFAICARAEGGR